MRNLARRFFLLAMLVVLSLLWLSPFSGDVRNAVVAAPGVIDPALDQVPRVVIDMDPTGNPNNGLLSRFDNCASVAAGANIEIDVVIDEVHPDNKIKAVEYKLNFEDDAGDPGQIAVAVHDVDRMLGAKAGSSVSVVVASTGAVSPAEAAASDIGTPEPAVHESGEGILGRLTIVGVTTGISNLSLTDVKIIAGDQAGAATIPVHDPIPVKNRHGSIVAVGDVNGDTIVDDRDCFPKLADPSNFTIELFADFAEVDPDLDAFQLTITSGENGFPAGLYVTPGPSFPPGGDRLIRIDMTGAISVVRNGLNSATSMVFARGSYGEGILIAEPRDLRIRRLLPDGTLTSFAENVGAAPYGSPILAYGPDGLLYGAGGSSGTDAVGNRDVLQINPDGTSSVFASIPESLFPAPIPTTFVQRHQALAFASISGSGQWQEGGGLISGTFSIARTDPTMNETLFAISDGTAVTKLTHGLSGLELVELGPGGPFGSDLFVAQEEAQTLTADGSLSILATDGTLTSFLTNIDSIDVAFDTEGVLGGGMFVSDGTNRGGPGKIWRIVPRVVGGTAELLVHRSGFAAQPVGGSGWPVPYAAIASAAAVALALAAGGWYTRRRWLR